MKNLIIGAIAVILVGAGAFFGGTKFQESKRTSNGPRQFEQSGWEQRGDHAAGQEQFQSRFRGSGGRPVSGEVISADDNSITVKLSDGSSKIVLLSDNTSISKTIQGEKSDLKTGEQVFVVGEENPDGSVTARNIQLDPTLDNEPLRPQE